ncbi:MAG: prepilin-type N-terminal cleavage/methylation domain-containing protein [Lentimonas sp.]|jgi:prepilin-type N-terminal cleavage/methylation domain-containing protein
MNTVKMKTRSAAKRAFTLIEIMVATVIMVVLVGLVIQITSEVLKVWTRSSGRLSANAEARIAMDLITQDLETAVFRNNGQQWLRVQGPETTDGDYDQDNTVSLKLFSPALDRPQQYSSSDTIPAGSAVGDDIPGDICAIGYRLQYKESYEGGDPVYALYRRVVNSQQTFEHYLDTGDAASSQQGELITTGTADWSDTGPDSITDEDNYLVTNIVEFKVLIYLDDGTNDPENADAITLELEPGHVYAYGGTGGLTTQLLYADVILTVVSDEGLEILRLLQDARAGTGYDDADDVVREYGEVFTRRVNFMAHPL